MNIKVCIVEDDQRIAEPMAFLLGHSEGFECLAVFNTCEKAIKEMERYKPDVILMDINLPGMNGIEGTRKLKQMLPSTNILMLTVYEESEKIFESLIAGASGYLLKRTPKEELLQAIRDVHSGGSPMTSNIARKVVHYFQKPAKDPELENLSTREQEVLELLAKGAMYKEIADKLNISLDGVRKRIRGIYQKLQVRSRTEAVLKFLNK